MEKDKKDFIIGENYLPRRKFLQTSLLMAVPLMLGGLPLPSFAATSSYVPPSRKRGSTSRSVLDFGALGNGVHDDTAAIQKAVDSLPADGGTIVIPAGTYMIDALKSINLRSLMYLKLDVNAKLVAIPNNSDVSRVLQADVVHDVEIAGGQIIGERDQHKGTTGEGGHCIVIKGCSAVTIRNIGLSRGWGDGLSVGPHPVFGKNFIYCKDIAVSKIVCNGNRRNGLSITNVIGMKVFDSEFSDTNGTVPQCGIDVEPNKDIDGSGYNDQVWIENCVMRGNAAYGVNVWNRARNLTITKCTIKENKSCGLVTRGLTTGTFTNNLIYSNMKTGMFIQTGTVDLLISGNTSYNNYLKLGPVSRAPFCMSGVSSKIQKDLIVGSGTSNIRVGSNCYQ